MDELTKIKERYDERKNFATTNTVADFYFNWLIQKERELIYAKILRRYFTVNISNIKFMEIGAGGGDNIFFFARRGIKWENIWANELLGDRFKILEAKFPNSNLYKGDASQLGFKQEFDIVFQSTVFTSVLDDDLKQRLANKMMEMVKPDGIILWYDFIYDNPRNKNVKGIKKSEIRKLFTNAKDITFSKVTLAPPISRRFYRFYNIINTIFPFLRTHIIAVIKK
jgi:2-polyprenyl-3-methyl-5-hydroxy-6-metoxy-1,4-benzoquinol methylase